MMVVVQLLGLLVALAVLLSPTSEAHKKSGGGKPITKSDIEQRFGNFELPSVVKSGAGTRNGFQYVLLQQPYEGPFECNPYIDVALQICFKQYIGSQHYLILREFMNSQICLNICQQYHIDINSYHHLGSFFIAIFKHAMEFPAVIQHQSWLIAIQFFYQKISISTGPPPVEIGSSHGITLDMVGIFQAITLESVNANAQAQKCLEIVIQFILSSVTQLISIFNSLRVHMYQTRASFLIAFLKKIQTLQTCTPPVQQSITMILTHISHTGAGGYPLCYKLCQTSCPGGGTQFRSFDEGDDDLALDDY